METTTIIISLIIGTTVMLLIIYFLILYAVKAAIRETQKESALTNYFLMTIMRKMGIDEEDIDDDLFYVFPESKENEPVG